MNITALELSIISLSFHPQGDYLAIASGSKLEVWKWNPNPSFNSSSTSSSSSMSDINSNRTLGRYSRSIIHTRNIRAVGFHPTGDFLFAAAPDKPKPASESLIYCK